MTQDNADAPATKQDILDLRKDLSTRFEGIDSKFVGIDARFGQIDARFEQIDARFEQIDARFEQIDGKIDAMDAKFDKKIDRIAADQSRLRGEVFDLAHRIEQRIDERTFRLLHFMEDFAGKTQEVDRRTIVFDKILGEYRVRLDDHEERIRSLEDENP